MIGGPKAALSTDEALLAGTILACAEFMADGPSPMGRLKGASAIMITPNRFESRPASKLTRAFVYYTWVGTFALPHVLGAPSAYETAVLAESESCSMCKSTGR